MDHKGAAEMEKAPAPPPQPERRSSLTRSSLTSGGAPDRAGLPLPRPKRLPTLRAPAQHQGALLPDMHALLQSLLAVAARPAGYGDLSKESMERYGKDRPAGPGYDPKLGPVDEKGMPHNPNERYDDDGHLARSGNTITASSHIITAVIGTGVLALGWALSWLGWVAGVFVLFMFAGITYFACNLLIDCYRYPRNGQQRNYTYIQAVDRYLGKRYTFWCGLVQYGNMFGTGIGYTITSGLAIQAILRSNCFHRQDFYSPELQAQVDEDPPFNTLITGECCPSPNGYLILYGALEILFSQLQDFDRLWFISVIAAICSFGYSLIGLGLSLGMTIRTAQGATGYNQGSVGGRDGALSKPAQNVTVDKAMSVLNALGAIAFAYSYSYILTEITDTVAAPEVPRMYKANAISVSITTAFYGSIGILSYAAFGDPTPDNLLQGFGFYRPFWLIDIANVAIFIHLIGAYQVWTQPLYAFLETAALRRCGPETAAGRFMRWELGSFPLPGLGLFRVSPFRFIWRTLYVCLTTVIAALLPFFGAVVGILGSIGFWPLTIFFPVCMHIVQRKIPRWSPRWLALQTLNIFCLFITLGGLAGSVYGVVTSLATGYTPFNSPCYTNDAPYN